MKGILLAGGVGSRLGACTWATSKQLLPVYDKPMVYYPLSSLMLAGIRDILIVSDGENLPSYEKLFGDGSHLGLSIKYRKQTAPRGIADALLVCEDDIEGESVCLILGDNVFYGQGFADYLNEAKNQPEGARIFGYPVSDAGAFGVARLGENGEVISLEEKPVGAKEGLAVPGLYFYDSKVLKYAKTLAPSARGELEITDLNKLYLAQGALYLTPFGRGLAWLDTGTPTGLLQASQFVETVQSRQGLYIACIEEVAWRMGYITQEELSELAARYPSTEYGSYIIRIGGNHSP